MPWMKKKKRRINKYSPIRFMVQKNVANNDTEESSTCLEENVKAATTDNSENGTDAQPPQKKKRLSNREYKKLMKGQNKVKFN